MSESRENGSPAPGLDHLPLSESLLRFLEGRLSVNFPPAGFEPLREDDARIQEFFLPPRPDKAIAPKAYENWQRAMSGPPIWPKMPEQVQEADFLRALFLESPLRNNHRLAGVARAPTEAASANWSGAYVRPRGFSAMSLVQGLWRAPNPNPPPTPQPGTYASSAWIGLDGHDPASRSLPQIGTGHWVTVDGATSPDRTVFAWWQWWLPHAQQNGQIVIQSLPIAAGDSVYAQVQAIDAITVSLFIINLSTNLAFPAWFKVVHPNPLPVTGPNPLPSHVEGRTAEWILERPRHLDSDVIYQLADYGEATFESCNAGTGPFNNLADIDLSRAGLMRMTIWDPTGNQVPGAVASVPERDGNDSIKLHYLS